MTTGRGCVYMCVTEIEAKRPKWQKVLEEKLKRKNGRRWGCTCCGLILSLKFAQNNKSNILCPLVEEVVGANPSLSLKFFFSS